MKWILTVALLQLTVVFAVDYVCPDGKSKKSITIKKDQSFLFDIAPGYGAKSKCGVVYKPQKKGKTRCKKIKFSCTTFDLPNKSGPPKCKKGDKLKVGKQFFCKTKAPEVESTKPIKLMFLSDKKDSSGVATCSVMCADSATTTPPPSPTTAVTTAPGPNSMLNNLNINPNTITISGFSSGGYFASQFHTAFSSKISGMGAVESGPPLSWLVEEDNVLWEQIQSLAASGQIDPIDNMLDDNVYIFQGTLDSVVPFYRGIRMKNYYQNFLPESQIELKDDIEAEHGFPTDNPSQGGSCENLNPPYFVNNCNYNGAYHILNKILGNIATEETENDGSFSTYDQNEFFDNSANDNGLDDEGYVFIPDRCANGTVQCHFHLHLHGCTQEKGWVEDGYVQRTGFVELAKKNDIVVMFPQIKHNFFYNPNGCWNFQGYLNDSDMYKFATKTGAQMKGMARMVEKVAGISMF